MFVQMEQKDVDPRTDDVLIAVKPAEFYTLLQNEQLINTQYKTSNGTSIEAFVLKTYGVPVISSNNFPGGSTISVTCCRTATTATRTTATSRSPSPWRSRRVRCSPVKRSR
jgi:hypothetical protein